MSHKTLLIGSLVLLALAFSVVIADARSIAAPSSSFVITVNTTADQNGGGASCSLREAITSANTDTNYGGCTRVSVAGTFADRIDLPSGTYVLTIVGNEDANIAGDLDITDTVTISGTGSTTTIIDGNGTTTGDRVFEIHPGAGNVSVSGVVIKNGISTPYHGAGGGIKSNSGISLKLSNCVIIKNEAANGGGIFSTGTLEINGCTINNNSSSFYGGGISSGDTLTIINSNISDNISGSGGGIDNTGAMTITNSAISGNTSTDDGGGLLHDSGGRLGMVIVNSTVFGNSATTEGGGIFVRRGMLTIIDSTIRKNDAPFGGGIQATNPYTDTGFSIAMTIKTSAIISNTANTAAGIRITGTVTVNIVNSTISGNSALASGGGMSINSGVTINLSSVTVSANSSDSDNNGSGNGAGLNIASGVTTTLKNTIVSKNDSHFGDGPNCFGTLTSVNYTLFGDPSSCTIPIGIGNQNGNPFLATLANNGGPTMTHALLDNSPAIDAGDLSGCTDHQDSLLVGDQRGYIRLVDGPDPDSISTCDLGAFEYGSTPSLKIFLPLVLK